MARHQVLVVLEYEDEALTPGGTMRCEPSTVGELVEEIDRSMNASNFGGLISLRLKVQTPPDPA
jgi:hypothetical protein